MSIATAPTKTTAPASSDAGFWASFWAEMGPVVLADATRGLELLGQHRWEHDSDDPQGGRWVKVKAR